MRDDEKAGQELPEAARTALRDRRILSAILIVRKECGVGISQSIKLIARSAPEIRVNDTTAGVAEKKRARPLSSMILWWGGGVAVLWAVVMTLNFVLLAQEIISNAAHYHQADFIIDRSGLDAHGQRSLVVYGWDDKGAVFLGHNPAPKYWFVVGTVDGKPETIVGRFYHYELPQSILRLTVADLNQLFPKGGHLKVLINPAEQDGSRRILDENSSYIRDPQAVIAHDLKRSFLPALYIFCFSWVLSKLLRRR